MNKLEQLLMDNNLTPVKIGRLIGNRNISGIIERALINNNISSLSYEVLNTLSRILNVPISDILDETEVTGIKTQINNIEGLINKLKKNLSLYQKKGIYTIIDNNILIASSESINIEKDSLINIEPDINLFSVVLNGSQFNKEYIDNNINLSLTEKRKKRNIKDINFINNKLKSWASSFILINNSKDINLFILGINIYNSDNTFYFSEILGCQWNKKEIIYYKQLLNDPLTIEGINKTKKILISEVEFYRSIATQLKKFGIKN